MRRLLGKRSHIFVTLLLIIGGTAVVPLVISGVITITKNREALKDQIAKYLTRSAVAVANHAQFFIENYVDQCKKIADSMKVAAGVSGDMDPFLYLGERGLIEEYVKQDPNFRALYAINRDGKGAVWQPADLDKDVAELIGTLAKDAISGEFANQTVVIRFVRLEKLNDAGLIILVLVKDSVGEVFGVIAALVSLAPIGQDLIDEGKMGMTAYVVNERGDVLLHSDPGVAMLRPNKASLELVAEFIQSPVRITRSYESEWDGGKRRVIGTLAPVTGADHAKSIPLRWGVIVERDEKSAYHFVNLIARSTVVTGLVFLALSVAAAALFARQLAQPIRALADKSREIAAGNYGQKVDVKSQNEIGELASSFNEMSDALERHVEELRRAARENQELFIASIRTLSAAIDAKDPYTRGHSERVTRYSIIIAKQMGLSRDEIARLRICALLHDVGKIGIDDRILRKPSALTDDEFDIMKQHPVIGAQIMESIPQLADIIPGMKYHHEKWEGGGYPEGISGEDIPLQARIVAVADTFDAMTTTRPYQKAMELSYVITKMKGFANTRFDPAAVAGLVRAHQKGDIALENA